MNAPITPINCLGMNFPIAHTHTSVTEKNCFRIICVIASGLIVLSGKEKAHKHKLFCPVIAWVRGGLPTGSPGGQGSNVYVLCSQPKDQGCETGVLCAVDILAG